MLHVAGQATRWVHVRGKDIPHHSLSSTEEGLCFITTVDQNTAVTGCEGEHEGEEEEYEIQHPSLELTQLVISARARTGPSKVIVLPFLPPCYPPYLHALCRHLANAKGTKEKCSNDTPGSTYQRSMAVTAHSVKIPNNFFQKTTVIYVKKRDC